MKAISHFDKIFIHKEYIDFRKGVMSLAAIIQDDMELDPFKNYLFIFTNSSRNRLRIIYWDKTGFVMWYKILERGRYFWPRELDREVININKKILTDLMSGMNPWQQGHKEVNCSVV